MQGGFRRLPQRSDYNETACVLGHETPKAYSLLPPLSADAGYSCTHKRRSWKMRARQFIPERAGGSRKKFTRPRKDFNFYVSRIVSERPLCS
jgi:hypothetical protein